MKIIHSERNTILLISLLTIATFGSSFIPFQHIDKYPSTSTYGTEIFTGQAIRTQELHNALCSGFGAYDPNVYECVGKWIFHKYTVSVSAPKGWHFTGSPYVNLVQNNDGSYEWNGGYGFNMKITQQNSRYIEALISVSSRSIMINLACQAKQD